MSKLVHQDKTNRSEQYEFEAGEAEEMRERTVDAQKSKEFDSDYSDELLEDIDKLLGEVGTSSALALQFLEDSVQKGGQ